MSKYRVVAQNKVRQNCVVVKEPGERNGKMWRLMTVRLFYLCAECGHLIPENGKAYRPDDTRRYQGALCVECVNKALAEVYKSKGE